MSIELGTQKYMFNNKDHLIEHDNIIVSDRIRLLAEIEALEKRDKELSEIIGKLNSDIATLSLKTTNINKDISDKEQHICGLNVQIRTLNNEINELMVVKQQYETAVGNINKDIVRDTNKIITINADGTKIPVSIGTLVKKSLYFQNMFSGDWSEAKYSEICISASPIFMDWYIYYSRHGVLPKTYNKLLEPEFIHFCDYYVIDIDLKKVLVDTNHNDVLLSRMAKIGNMLETINKTFGETNDILTETNDVLKGLSNIYIIKYLTKAYDDYEALLYSYLYKDSLEFALKIGDTTSHRYGVKLYQSD